MTRASDDVTRRILESARARSRAVRGAAVGTAARRSEIHGQHVERLASLLLKPVRTALDEETTRLAADTWVAEADAVARWLNLPEAPGGTEANRPLLARIRDALAPSTSPAQVPEGDPDLARRAHLAVAQELASKLREGQLTPASDADVTQHATELAQLLVSNWFSVLEHALQDAGSASVLALTFHALPEDARPDDLVEGSEAFALPPGECLKLLLDFQQQLVQAGSHALLSPTMELERSQMGWKLRRPRQEAAGERLAHTQPASAVPPWAPAHAGMEVVSPWALARPLDVWGHRPAAGYSAGAEAHMISAAVQMLSDEQGATAIRRYYGAKPFVVKRMAEQVRLDLCQAADQHWEQTNESMPLNQVRIHGDQDEHDFASAYRVGISAVACMAIDYDTTVRDFDWKSRVGSGTFHLDARQQAVVELGVDVARTILWEASLDSHTLDGLRALTSSHDLKWHKQGD